MTSKKKKKLFEIDSYEKRGKQGLADPNKVGMGVNVD